MTPYLQMGPPLKSWHHYKAQSQQVGQEEVVDLVSQPREGQQGKAGDDKVDHWFLTTSITTKPVVYRNETKFSTYVVYKSCPLYRLLINM